MKRILWILLLLTTVTPAWAAKKLTVQQLKDLLVSMHEAKKGDSDVVTSLMQIELSEQLTPNFIATLGPYLPGQLSMEQIGVLEAQSSTLIPPASELPTVAAPDAVAQKALIDKAADYITKTYAQLPHLSATKSTIRFQDSMDPAVEDPSVHASLASNDPSLTTSDKYIQFVSATQGPIESVNGAEQISKIKDKTMWGENRQIALFGQGPVLTTVFDEAQATGKIKWMRWETANGRQAAVFSFSVDKKKSHYAVNYCCFPAMNQTGSISETLNTRNLQTYTEWKDFKATVPYHGELFVDAQTGVVLRLVTFADFKSSDVVHQEDTRIDYGAETVGGKVMILPVSKNINTEVVASGDSSSGRYQLRHTLFVNAYKGYQFADAAGK